MKSVKAESEGQAVPTPPGTTSNITINLKMDRSAEPNALSDPSCGLTADSRATQVNVPDTRAPIVPGKADKASSAGPGAAKPAPPAATAKLKYDFSEIPLLSREEKVAALAGLLPAPVSPASSTGNGMTTGRVMTKPNLPVKRNPPEEAFYHLPQQHDNCWYAKIHAYGRETPFLVDTDASKSVVSDEFYYSLPEPRPGISPAKVKFRCANGTSMTSIGICHLQFRIGNQSCSEPFFICPTHDETCVLGEDIMQLIGFILDVTNGQFWLDGNLDRRPFPLMRKHEDGKVHTLRCATNLVVRPQTYATIPVNLATESRQNDLVTSPGYWCHQTVLPGARLASKPGKE